VSAPGIASTVLARNSSNSKTGNLVLYRAIETGSSAFDGNGGLAGVKSRMKDLQILWDEAKPAMKPAQRPMVDEASIALWRQSAAKRPVRLPARMCSPTFRSDR
jgi:hypothetical protein